MPRAEVYRPSPEAIRVAEKPWQSNGSGRIAPNSEWVHRNRIQTAGRVRAVIKAWESSHTGERLTLRMIRRKARIPVGLDTVSTILDRMTKQKSSFEDPRRFSARVDKIRIKRIRRFIARWPMERPKLTRPRIAEELGIPKNVVKRLVKELRQKERKKLREPRKFETVSVKNVTRGIASYHPEFVSVGNMLKSAGLPWKPTETARWLRRNGFDVAVSRVTSNGREYKRYFVSKTEAGRIIRRLKSAFGSPLISPRKKA